MRKPAPADPGNVGRFRTLLARADVTQAQAAAFIAEATQRPLSVRTVRSWLQQPGTVNAQSCPDWAVAALEDALRARRLLPPAT